MCKDHGEFIITPNRHLSRYGYCLKCVDFSMNSEKFIKRARRIHGDRYSYKSVIYDAMKIPVSIECPKHGHFWQRPANHLHGQGCPKCKISKGEERIRQWLALRNIDYIFQYSINKSIWDLTNEFPHGYDGCPEIKRLRFDFYLPAYDLFIEFDGKQHSEPVKFFGGDKSFIDTQRRDTIKNQFILDNNLNMLRIDHLQFNNVDVLLEKRIFGTN